MNAANRASEPTTGPRCNPGGGGGGNIASGTTSSYVWGVPRKKAEFRAKKVIGKDCQSHYPYDLDEEIAMPTRNINLTDEQDAFVEEIVRAGKYQNASEVMRDAVRGLQQRLEADELKLELMRTQIKAGLDALDRGAYTEVDEADLEATLDGLPASTAT
jgi:antitoxin ParD1/3/4